MNELKIYETLKEAYETTTQLFNHFKNVVGSIKWDHIFEEDGETYFCFENGFTLTVENMNPFLESWKPTVYFSDNSVLTF